MNIGIVGAENSHASVVSRLLNIDNLLRGVRVTHIWGEKPRFAKKAAAEGQVPNIVKDPADMIGCVDGVMIDHRDGKYHLPVARKFVKAGLPVFVDKPMGCNLNQCRKFLELVDSLGGIAVTMSSLALQPWTCEVKRELRKLGKLRVINLCGPGEYNSRYGGIWFYGIHQTEILVELLGAVAGKVVFQKNHPDSSAQICCGDGLSVTMNFLTGSRYGFGVTAIGDKGTYHSFCGYQPEGAETVVRNFVNMLRRRKNPPTAQRMLAPLAILQAMEKSLTSGKSVKIATV